jgi:hypothetical protein
MKYSISVTRLLKLTTMLLWLAPATAQQKYEREYSIKETQIPPDALSFVNEIFKDVKINWYGEESLTGTSIEAKVKSSGKQFSIEFSDSGKILDVEILTKFRALPDNARDIMTEKLKEEFKKFKIVKTQIQWIGSRDLLKAALSDEKLPMGVVIQYELIVRAKKDELSKYHEVLFDQSGNIKSIREIIQGNVDNLFY